MTKQEFISKLFNSFAYYEGCGQCMQTRLGTIWVDDLKGGRVSIKVKPFLTRESAQRCAEQLLENLREMPGSFIDAATKADVYKVEYRGYICGWAARLRCDKHW